MPDGFEIKNLHTKKERNKIFFWASNLDFDWVSGQVQGIFIGHILYLPGVPTIPIWFRKIISLNFNAFKRLLRSVIIRPALEKILSQGTEVSAMQSLLNAMSYSSG